MMVRFTVFFLSVVCVLAFAAHPAGAASAGKGGKESPQVVAAAGSSSAPGSASIDCLLNPECTGYWTPQAKDAGINEGVYIRFAKPTYCNYIEIAVDGELPDGVMLQAFLDAQTSSRRNSGKKSDSDGGKDDVIDIDVELAYETNAPKRSVYRVSAVNVDDEREPLRYAAQSVFIKLASFRPGEVDAAAPRIVSIRFYQQETLAEDDHQATPLALRLPRIAAAAVSATSILEPHFAYSPTKLFDSQPDMAWSTNGAKNNGVGESIDVSFSQEEEIHGIMLWNGYQRSPVHYQANNRVKSLKVAGQTLAVKDAMGAQTLMLPIPIKKRDVTLEIAGVYPGGSYKDTLLSELRFIGADNTLLLPATSPVVPDAPKHIASLLDKTFTSFISAMEWDGANAYAHDSSIRLRGNGSFVIYTDMGRDAGEDWSHIIEGNWDPQPDGTLRLFGKKYRAVVGVNADRGSYIGGEALDARNKTPAPRIFKSSMKVLYFNDLSPQEQKNAVMQKIRSFPLTEEGESEIVFSLNTDAPHSKRWEPEFVENCVKLLRKVNPVCFSSDVYTDMTLPPAFTFVSE